MTQPSDPPDPTPTPAPNRKRKSQLEQLIEDQNQRAQWEAKRRKLEADDAENQRLFAERARAARAQQGAPARGTLGDGRFRARFVRVGQGDCIVMGTPGGRVVLVDCGSLATESTRAELRRVHDSLYDAKFLGPLGIIDVLVLTHTDKDHHNLLHKVLDPTVQISSLYHSNEFAHYHPTSPWIRERADQAKIWHVKHCAYPSQAAADYRGSISLGDDAVPAMADQPAGQRINVRDANGGIRIIDEPHCTMTILAADVTVDHDADNGGTGDHDAADHANRRSVVTLVEAFGRKLLLCGDATRSTERYLIHEGRYRAENRNRLSQVEVVHVSHHGSNLTSSSQAFVDVVDPREQAVISAGKVGKRGHHLPSWEVVIRYARRFRDSRRAQVASHLCSCWDAHTGVLDGVDGTLVQAPPAGVSDAGPQAARPKQRSIPWPVYITGSYEADIDIDWGAR